MQCIIEKIFSLSFLQGLYYCAAILFNIFGLWLGYYYFIKRIDYEDKRRNKERQCGNVKVLLDMLKEYDNLVFKILNLAISSEEELKSARGCMEKIISIVDCYVGEDRKELLDFSSDDMKRFMEYHSYIEKNDVIMRSKISDMRPDTLSIIKQQCLMLMKQSTVICLSKMK